MGRRLKARGRARRTRRWRRSRTDTGRTGIGRRAGVGIAYHQLVPGRIESSKAAAVRNEILRRLQSSSKMANAARFNRDGFSSITNAKKR